MPGRRLLRSSSHAVVVLEEASRPPGAGNRLTVAEYGTRVPSLLLTLAERERQEETARAPVDGRRELAPGRQSAAELAALAERTARACSLTSGNDWDAAITSGVMVGLVPTIHQPAPALAERWILGTLGTSPSASKPEDDSLRRRR